MNKLAQLLRKCLAHWGYEVRQISTPTLRLEEFFLAAKAMILGDCDIHIFDDDPRTIRVISKARPPGKIHTHYLDVPVEALHSVASPRNSIWVLINVERLPLRGVLAAELLSKETGVVIVSGSLGAFNRGTSDFAAIETLCSQNGFELVDVAALNQPSLFNGGQARIFLIFSRPELLERYVMNPANRVRRVDQARAFLPVPAAQYSRFRWITSAGTFGHPAGVFNPGALAAGSGYLVLMRGENDWWAAQKESEISHFSSWKIELVTLNGALATETHKTVSFEGIPSSNGLRVEDFRLFRVGDQVFSNHAVVTLPSERAAVARPVQLESQIVRVGISLLSESQGMLRFVGFPIVDIPTRSIEKNWAVFTRKGEVFVIYSMSPYRVLRATCWPKMEFVTVVNRPLSLSIGGDSGMIRNSVNPVDYDERHFLHVVHVVHLSKQYVFWAILIDKDTLIPSFVSEVPMARGGYSVEASIVYLCSIVAETKRVLLFAGINDCGSGVWEIDRSELDARWRKLEK